MKRILLPTDFSEVSRNAIDYALEMFAKEVYSGNVEFLLFHAHEVVGPIASFGGAPLASNTELEKQAKQNLYKELLHYRSKFPSQTINEVFVIGDVLEEIEDFSEENNIDLIVTGSHGRTGIDRWLMGSHAADVARKAECSVFVVPAHAKYSKIERVVFATDFKNLKDFRILNPLRDLIDSYDAELMMLHVYPEKETSAGDREWMNDILESYFDREDYKYFFLESNDTVEGIEQFIKGYNANLLVLVGQERSMLEEIFHKSVSKHMILHAEIPVFVLHENEKVEEDDDEDENISFSEKVQSKVTEWRADLDEMKVKMHLGSKDLADEVDKGKSNIANRIHEIQEKLDDVEDIAEDKWKHFKKEIGQAIGHLKKAFVGD